MCVLRKWIRTWREMMGALEASNGMREPPRSGENYIDTGPFVWYLYALFQAGKVFSWALMWPMCFSRGWDHQLLSCRWASWFPEEIHALRTADHDVTWQPIPGDGTCWIWVATTWFLGIPGPEWLGPCVFLGWLHPRDQIG
jgi:hypothetical protein